MSTDPLEALVAVLLDNRCGSLEQASERVAAVGSRLEPVFRAAAEGDATWVVALREALCGHEVSTPWRAARDFAEYAANFTFASARAVASLEGPEDSDLLWEVALTPVGGLAGLRDRFPHLSQPGAMAAVASLVLFSRRPFTFPIYEAGLSMRTLQRLLGERLDNRTVATRLVSYYEGLERVRRLLKERGAPVRSNLDALWALKLLDDSRSSLAGPRSQGPNARTRWMRL